MLLTVLYKKICSFLIIFFWKTCPKNACNDLQDKKIALLMKCTTSCNIDDNNDTLLKEATLVLFT